MSDLGAWVAVGFPGTIIIYQRFDQDLRLQSTTFTKKNAHLRWEGDLASPVHLEIKNDNIYASYNEGEIAVWNRHETCHETKFSLTKALQGLPLSTQVDAVGMELIASHNSATIEIRNP